MTDYTDPTRSSLRLSNAEREDAVHELAAGAGHLIGKVDWVHEDFAQEPARHFIKHDWQGTVIRTGGYHYDLPSANSSRPW